MIANVIAEHQLIMIIVGLMFVGFIIVAFITANQKPQRSDAPHRHFPHPEKSQHEEVMDTLEWMMQHQIITVSEYNRLIVKCSQFLPPR